MADPVRMRSSGRAHEDVAAWLAGVLAEVVSADPASVRRDVPLWDYGVDSLVAATLVAEVEDELGVVVDPGDVPPGITLDELAEVVLDCRLPDAEESSDVA